MSLALFASLKCPLIGCTVTVSWLNCPLWYLNVAYLTPPALGVKIRADLFVVFFFFNIIYFFSTSGSDFYMSFEGDLFFIGTLLGLRLFSTPFHNSYPPCWCEGGGSVNMVTCLPSQPRRKASNPASGGPWGAHLIDLAMTSPHAPATSNWAASAVLKDLRVLWSHHGVYGCGSGCTTF